MGIEDSMNAAMDEHLRLERLHGVEAYDFERSFCEGCGEVRTKAALACARDGDYRWTCTECGRPEDLHHSSSSLDDDRGGIDGGLVAFVLFLILVLVITIAIGLSAGTPS